MTTLLTFVPPINPARVNYNARNLSVGTPLPGCRRRTRSEDATGNSSLLYGLFVFLMSLAVILGMRLLGWGSGSVSRSCRFHGAGLIAAPSVSVRKARACTQRECHGWRWFS